MPNHGNPNDPALRNQALCLVVRHRERARHCCAYCEQRAVWIEIVGRADYPIEEILYACELHATR